MDIVLVFKNYLLQEKNSPSKVTIKNYLSDVRKFISWYQITFKSPFRVEKLTSEVISNYQTFIRTGINSSLPAASSAKRYLSSLRKFASFLIEADLIKKNPFMKPNTDQNITDPFYLLAFKNYLYGEQASQLTIKNYVADIKQFLSWLSQVTLIDAQNQSSSLMNKIDNIALEQYKMRLFKDVQLSPLSINRKLSSLRRYVRWLGDKHIINADFVEATTESEKLIKEPPLLSTPDLPLTALQELEEPEEQNETSHAYSSFAPLRLMQHTTKLITLGTDLLFFNPIANLADSIHFSLLKSGKEKIFAPVSTIIETSSHLPKGTIIKTIIPKSTSILPPLSANFASILPKVPSYERRNNPEYVKNFTKELYAPLKISTKHMSWKERLLFKLRYSRPAWYTTYHSFTFVHYLHFAIVVIASVISAIALYQTWNEPLKRSPSVLAEQSQAPPRMFTFQGRLLDDKNTPITAETPLRFALYNNPTATGAAKLWQESQNIKPDQNGYFSASLGRINRIDQSVFTENANLYMGISVNDNKELTPRQEIPTTNYSANTQTVQGLKPITDSSAKAQNVLLALDSSGNLTIGGSSNHTFQTTGGQFNLSGQALFLTTNPGSNGNIQINPDGSGIIDLQKPIQNTSNSITSGGIPGAVEVADILSVLTNSSTQSALVVNQNGTGDVISGQRNGIAKFRIDGTGNEYLSGNLILNGDTIGVNSTFFDIAGSTVTNLTIGNNATVISIGKSSSGITSINNSITVHGISTLIGGVNAFGLITANAGLAIPDGQKLIFDKFTQGAIPFIDANSQVVQDAASFSWDDTKKTLHEVGSLCVNSVSTGTCDSTPGTITGKTLNTIGTADLAEDYVSSQNLEPGDLVVAESGDNSTAIVKSTNPYQNTLIGIISTNPGITLNSDTATDPQHPNVYPLVLTGRVPVKVSSINGPIQPGDDLTSSTIPGVAMKAIGTGQIIGKALEAYSNPDASTSGKILAFVNLTYRSTQTTLTNDGNLSEATDSAILSKKQTQSSFTTMFNSFSDLTDTINLGAIKAQSITTQRLQVTTGTIMIGEQTLKDYIATIVEQMITKELDKRLAQAQLNSHIVSPVTSNMLPTTDQTVSPTPTLAQNATPQTASNSANSKTSQTFPLYNSIASISATVSMAGTATATMDDSLQASPAANTSLQNQQAAFANGDTFNNNKNQYISLASASGQLTYVPNFQSDFATFSQGIIALGPTSLTDLAVSSTIRINNNLRLTQNSLDTVGSDLNIQPLRQGNIAFMGGLVTIDTQGNLRVNGNALFVQNVNVNGELAAGIIAPIPDQNIVINLKNKADKKGSSLIITNATGSAALQINQAGDVISSGSAIFGNILSNGLSIVRGAQADTSTIETIASGSAGKGMIEEYQTERTIFTPYVTDHSLIYITANSNTGSLTPYLARQTVEDPSTGTKGSFTIAIPVQTTTPISFNWLIVN